MRRRCGGRFPKFAAAPMPGPRFADRPRYDDKRKKAPDQSRLERAAAEGVSPPARLTATNGPFVARSRKRGRRPEGFFRAFAKKKQAGSR
jgi:hypothetical protein